MIHVQQIERAIAPARSDGDAVHRPHHSLDFAKLFLAKALKKLSQRGPDRRLAGFLDR